MGPEIYREDGPPEEMTLEQIVSWNLRDFRKAHDYSDDQERAVHFTQEDLADLMREAGFTSWRRNTVKELELVWQSAIDPSVKRRRFRLDELAELAVILDIPIIEWFIPPPESRFVVTPSHPQSDLNPVVEQRRTGRSETYWEEHDALSLKLKSSAMAARERQKKKKKKGS